MKHAEASSDSAGAGASSVLTAVTVALGFPEPGFPLRGSAVSSGWQLWLLSSQFTISIKRASLCLCILSRGPQGHLIAGATCPPLSLCGMDCLAQPRSCASWRVESASWDPLEPQWESGSVGEEDGVNACWEGYREVPLCDLYLLYWWAAGRWTETIDSPGYCAFLGQRWGGDCPRRVCN